MKHDKVMIIHVPDKNVYILLSFHTPNIVHEKQTNSTKF